jgi:hypothetical protein
LDGGEGNDLLNADDNEIDSLFGRDGGDRAKVDGSDLLDGVEGTL